MAENCPGCGYRFDRGDDGFFLGAYTVNLCVNETVIFAALMFMVLGGSSDSAASAWPILVAMLAGAVLLPIFFYPFSKTLWCAVYLASDPLELNEIVDAIDALGRAGAAAPEAIADGSPAAPKESEPDPGRR